MDTLAIEHLAEHLATWIHTQVVDGRGAGVVFGLSGGVDSAVVCALAKRAFPDRALGLLLPCDSDRHDAEDALLTARHFAVATATVDLTEAFHALLGELVRASAGLADDRLARANVKPRLRMTALYAVANHLNYRVLGTGNLSELTVGYFTKYGDGGVDLLPLGSLTKTHVRELARHLGVPDTILAKPPSAGLWPEQTDEGEMGMSYADLDAYISGENDKVAGIVEAMKAASRHKRALPAIAPLPDEPSAP